MFHHYYLDLDLFKDTHYKFPLTDVNFMCQNTYFSYGFDDFQIVWNI